MSKRSSMYRDSRWQQKRLEIMERDNWTCRSCGASGDGTFLNVHHAYYEAGCKPWEYDNDLLITWCEDCHEKHHRRLKEIQKAYMQMPAIAKTNLYYLCWLKRYKTLQNIYPVIPDEPASEALRSVADAFIQGEGTSHE